MLGLLLRRDRDRDTIGMVGMVYFETTVFPSIEIRDIESGRMVQTIKISPTEAVKMGTNQTWTYQMRFTENGKSLMSNSWQYALSSTLNSMSLSSRLKVTTHFVDPFLRPVRMCWWGKMTPPPSFGSGACIPG